MGGRYPGGRRHIRLARERIAQKKIGLNSVPRDRGYGNRPQKDQKAYYSGKKRHTLKTQVRIEQGSLKIIDVQEAKGGEHDFKIYKDTI
jgi:hypothetical protein